MAGKKFSNNPTAAILIIGNEILSGRTLDTNTQTIAKQLSTIGIVVAESRTVPDEQDIIKQAVLELSGKYNYLFTTGGIGPTHDDITAASIAAAFDLPYVRSEEIYQILLSHYSSLGQEVNKAREKMAYIPEGATLVPNAVTNVPGFMINNVITMAGIPEVMQAMLAAVLPKLQTGQIVHSISLELLRPESQIAAILDELQNKYSQIDIGSYPFNQQDKKGTNIVMRGLDQQQLEQAMQELKTAIKY